MRFIKKSLLIFLLLIIVGVSFRGCIYRHIVTYKPIGQRIIYQATDKRLIDFIESNCEGKKDLNIEDIIKLGLKITSKKLNFTFDKNDIDPNKLIDSKTAHCVGYAAFFSTTTNYLLKKYNLGDTWSAKPQIGLLYIFRINIHNHIDSPFFKDHDFVVIKNIKTGENIAVDPNLYDYFYIDHVKMKKE